MGFDYEQFGDRVRALRKERDITQAELASVLNVESHYIAELSEDCLGARLRLSLCCQKCWGSVLTTWWLEKSAARSKKNWSGSSTNLKKSGWILFEGLRLEKV